MIKNDWQLRVTQKRIKDFEDALFEVERLPVSETQPWLRAAQRESLESELNNLCRQVNEYQLLRSGKGALPGPEVIQQVPELLIKTRISKGLNQEELANRLGVTKQCIQQYEQTNYAHVTLSMAQKVMQALSGLSVTPAANVKRKKTSAEKPPTVLSRSQAKTSQLGTTAKLIPKKATKTKARDKRRKG